MSNIHSDRKSTLWVVESTVDVLNGNHLMGKRDREVGRGRERGREREREGKRFQWFGERGKEREALCVPGEGKMPACLMSISSTTSR